MEIIICPHCGAKDDYSKSEVGIHIKATCNNCGKYIKFLPQGLPPKLHFGKYIGRELQSMIEPDEIKYLQWILGNVSLKAKVKSDIKDHLKTV